MIGNGIARMIEDAIERLLRRGIPGGAIRDQLSSGALPPAGNTGQGYTPDPDAVTRVSVRKNSTGSTYSRRRLNLIEGTGATITVADDGTNEEVDITIAASGGGGSLTVEEVDGSPTDSAVTKLVFPNGTLGISGHVATYTPSGGGGSLTVEEVDGSPTDSAVTKIVFPNGTLSIVAGVATYTPAGGGGGTSAQAAVMWHDNAKIVSGNALTIVQDGSQQYNVWCYQNSPANGDIFEHYFELASGTYTMEVLGLTANSRGIVDWTIDGAAAVTGQDWYSGGLTYNVRKTASVTIATSGGHTLRGTINGKNAGSSDYQMLITRIAFRP